jgi:hypothetical protein
MEYLGVVFIGMFLLATIVDFYYILRGNNDDTSRKNTRSLKIRPNPDPVKFMGRSRHIGSPGKG